MTGLRRLSAREELTLLRRAPALIPFLVRQGLSLEDSAALAHNAALLSLALEEGPRSPRQVLEAFSLTEIAELCEEYAGGEGLL